MKYLISFFWLIIFTKKLFFWLWLWQLKEYHLGRFKAHFETQKIKKLIFSFWGLRYPKLTIKTIIILSSGILLEFLILFYLFSLPEHLFYLSLLILIILAPIIFSFLVLSFQPITVFLRNRIIKKAKEKREKFKDLLVIGITGSYGKTSTKEFLATILSERFNVLKTAEHQNSEMGISQCILNDLKPGHQIFVCEMGAYNRGGIKLLSDIVKPRIGIITGINEQHMATFGSQKNIIQTKFELIEALPEDGLAILNDSDPKIKNEKLKIKNYNSKLKNIKLCSREEKTDIRAEDVRVEKEQILFKVFSKDGEFADFKVNLLGSQNIPNILAAACCAKELGISLEEISKVCQKLKPFSHQMELKKRINGLNIIDATYSANPDGVISHLDYLKIWPQKKVIVMPCLIELGKASKEVHKRIGKKIGQICDLAIITTKDRFKEIREGAIESGVKEENIIFLEKSSRIFKKLKSFSEFEAVVLLESRVPRLLIEQLNII